MPNQNEKIIQTRIQQKHATATQWENVKNSFTPKAGEVIIYDADYNATTNPAGYKYSRFKIGDGKTTVGALPFSPSVATQTAEGLMSAEDKTKLDGIATGAQSNQNAFSNVAVGSTTISADNVTDTLTLVAGSNITLTPDTTNDQITIAATDTNTDTKVTAVGNHYTPITDSTKTLSVAASSTTSATWGSTDLVTGINIQRDAAGHVTNLTVDSIQMPTNPNTDTNTTYSISKTGSTITLTGSDSTTFTVTDADTTYDIATSSTAGLVKIGYTENGQNYPVELSNDGKMFVNVPWTDTDTDTTYSEATTSKAGLMSAADKTKLDAGYAKKLETYYIDDNTKTYGTQYPAYVQWGGTGNVAVLKSDNYDTAVNKLIDRSTNTLLNIGNSNQPVYFSNGVPVVAESVEASKIKVGDTYYELITTTDESNTGTAGKITFVLEA
jgi:hypothetical protein